MILFLAEEKKEEKKKEESEEEDDDMGFGKRVGDLRLRARFNALFFLQVCSTKSLRFSISDRFINRKEIHIGMPISCFRFLIFNYYEEDIA